MTDGVPELPEDLRDGGESATLLAMLAYLRAVLVRKTHGLGDGDLSISLTPGGLSLGGLLHHMALVEDIWFHIRFLGNEAPEPWASVDWDTDGDWDFHAAADMSHEQLLAQFEVSVSRSDLAIASASLDDVAVSKGDGDSDIGYRWILVHMIEEYARHCGHADLIRESIDGATGD